MFVAYMNTAYLIYIIHYKPFELPIQNKLEIYNEITISILTIIYMSFKMSFEKRNGLGKVYIWIYLICILVNVLNLLINTWVTEAKKTYYILKFKILWLRYEIWKYKWFKEKKEDAKLFKKDRHASECYN
jgi:hypothetical protein